MKKINRSFLRRLIRESLGSINEASDDVVDPLGIGVLGAPASGKSYITNLMRNFANQRINQAFSTGKNLTVDILRGEIQKKPPVEQIKYFVEAYTMLREMSEDAPDTFGKWYRDILKLWTTKLKGLLLACETPIITVVTPDMNYVSLNNASSKEESISVVETISEDDAANIIGALHPYQDYKRVVRYYQLAQQAMAKEAGQDVTYDESGDEPDKILKRFDKLHDKDGDGIPEKGDYVTDVVLVHPENVATNIIQNANRVVGGGDGGRDSSSAIMAAYNDIEAGKQKYVDNAEESYYAPSSEDFSTNPEIQAALTNANLEDDVDRGDKPIDVFVQVGTMQPQQAFNLFSGKMEPEQVPVYKAFILFHAIKLDLPPEAEQALKDISGLNNMEALEILKAAAESGKYDYPHGFIKSKNIPEFERVLSGALQESMLRFWEKIIT